MFRRSFLMLCERECEKFNVVIVGGGPSGLSAAIRLKQLNADARIALVDKGATIGSHILSGACIETRSLEELLPDWKNKEGLPTMDSVTGDSFSVLTKTSAYRVPWLPPTLHNKGNVITSLGSLCRFLSEVATGLGVEIFAGFAAADVIIEDGRAQGIQLHDEGIDKKGQKGEQYVPGMIFKADNTIFAEGSRGSCTKKLEKVFNLRGEDCFQTYALGVKELWTVSPERHRRGQVEHTVGWPLTKDEHHDNTYGGSWLYHYGDNLVSLGFVVALDYKNPFTRPYMELQKWKTHPLIRPTLEGGKPISYGARTLVEGGFVSMPKLSFPGGVLVGDCAGFLNLPKVKGTHTSMKSGMLAAEAVAEDVLKLQKPEATSYTDRFRASWLYRELNAVRNVRQVFAMNFYAGMLYTGLATTVFRGYEPWTLRHKHRDHESLIPAAEAKAIEYPKPDGKLTFDLLTNLALSGTIHNSEQPPHLKVSDMDRMQKVNLERFDGPEQRFCPAAVYEWVDDGKGKKSLVINAQNCLHCKACDIKDVTQNINYTTPEGRGGPEYNAAM